MATSVGAGAGLSQTTLAGASPSVKSQTASSEYVFPVDITQFGLAADELVDLDIGPDYNNLQASRSRNGGRQLRAWLEGVTGGRVARGKLLEHTIRQVNPNASLATVGRPGTPRYNPTHIRALERQLQREVTNASRRAVRGAWRNEVEAVRNGTSTYNNWTFQQSLELLRNGQVKGYNGHHMWSVGAYPEKAGQPSNIRFMTRKQHFEAHGFNWQKETHGPPKQ